MSAHVCESITDDDGETIAVVHGDPDMSAETKAALAALIEAAREHFDAQMTPEKAQRQEVSRLRIQERNARLFGGGS